jgi:hypothetical protein
VLWLLSENLDKLGGGTPATRHLLDYSRDLFRLLDLKVTSHTVVVETTAPNDRGHVEPGDITAIRATIPSHAFSSNKLLL